MSNVVYIHFLNHHYGQLDKIREWADKELGYFEWEGFYLGVGSTTKQVVRGIWLEGDDATFFKIKFG